MSEKHIEIKIGQDPPHTTDFTAIVDVETGGRLFYEEVFPKHAERFVKCWNSHDALLDAIRNALVFLAIINMPTMGDPGDVATNDQIMKVMADSFLAAIKKAEEK